MEGHRFATRLTAREREIANLIGLGFTNRQIGRKLSISERTAEAHVQNILNKLGANNRAQIASWSAWAPLESRHQEGGRQPPPVLADAHVPPPSAMASSHSRRRDAIGLLAASVVAALVIATDDGPGPNATGALQLVDQFSGQAVDLTTWSSGTNQPDHVSLSESSGHVTIKVSGAATNDFNAGLGSRCKATGNFDAQVSFDLSAWPAFDGVWITLLATDTPGFNVYRASASWGDSYGGYLPPTGATVPATGTSGSLRLRREGTTMTAYYLAQKGWVAIARGAAPTTDTRLSAGLANISSATSFGGQPVTVDLHDFHLVAGGVTCI